MITEIVYSIGSVLGWIFYNLLTDTKFWIGLGVGYLFCIYWLWNTFVLVKDVEDDER